MRGCDVTVTITNWNGRQYLEDCLEAVRAQTVAPQEIILVDNASEDGSVELVRQRFPEVRIVSLPRNDGPCPARNAGLEAARTPLVLSIDNDAILAADCLERLLSRMAPGVAIAHPRALFFQDRSRIHYDGAELHYVGMMILRHFYAPASEARHDAEEIDAAVSVALLLDREAILAAGAYDPSHFILFEDHDLSYRVRARGYKIVHEPEALVFHKEGTAGISFRKQDTYSPRRVFLHSRNRWVVILKCHGARAIVLGLPGILLYETAYLFFAIKNRAFGAWLGGKRDVVRLLPRIWRERRRVQKSRVVPDRVLLKSKPLTISPLIRRGGVLLRLQHGLDRALWLWWRLVGPLT